MLTDKTGKVPQKIYRARGCTSCDNTGYKGRLALLEILKMNSELDDLLAQGASTKEIRDEAYRQGFFTLADDAEEFYRKSPGRFYAAGLLCGVFDLPYYQSLKNWSDGVLE